MGVANKREGNWAEREHEVSTQYMLCGELKSWQPLYPSALVKTTSPVSPCPPNGCHLVWGLAGGQGLKKKNSQYYFDLISGLIPTPTFSHSPKPWDNSSSSRKPSQLSPYSLLSAPRLKLQMQQTLLYQEGKKGLPWVHSAHIWSRDWRRGGAWGVLFQMC